MQFLKTLLWVLIAVLLALLASRNWSDVTLNLWGDLQADVKIPVLVGIVFLFGFLPTFLIQRAKLWAVRRRLEAHERVSEPVPAVPAEPDEAPDSPVI